MKIELIGECRNSLASVSYLDKVLMQSDAPSSGHMILDAQDDNSSLNSMVVSKGTRETSPR